VTAPSRIGVSIRFIKVMHSISNRGRAIKGRVLGVIILGWLACACPVMAGQYQLLAEQSNAVVIAAHVQNAEQVCNLDISVQGRPAQEREVQAPYFEARIDIKPQDTQTVTVTWRGKFKRVNGVAVNACPTQGQAQFQVVSDNAQLRAVWAGVFSQMVPAKAECVRSALQSDRVRYDWFDMNDKQVSPEDWKIQRALTQCDAFLARKKAWGEQTARSFACVLPGGLKTQCEGYFSATENGKTQPISREAAIQRQLEDKAWDSGVRETAAAKAGRQKKEQALKARLAAEEAASIKAQEEARIREEQEAKVVQARERKEKAEADHARRLKELDRLEQERLEKRSWMLKQLEKLRRDPKVDAKAEEGKPGNAVAPAAGAADAKAETKPEAKAEAKPEVK
jgi:hypothetical protein